MIRRKEDMVSEIRERMREGTGEVEIVHIFKKNELKGKARLCARLILKKDCSIGFHTHENEEEIFYIISGKGFMEENGKTFEVNAGDAILTGDGAGHSIGNKYDEPLEVLAVILLYS
ncbi:MAG: cupin domain-containing protein [Spirochaetales bacterium]|nr:cupin domain-containing protein [Spirochaetales bacterium]